MDCIETREIFMAPMQKCPENSQKHEGPRQGCTVPVQIGSGPNGPIGPTGTGPALPVQGSHEGR